MPYLAFASAAHCFSCGVRAGAAPEVLLAEPLLAEPLLAEPLLVEPPLAEPLPDCDVGVRAGPTRDAGTAWVATPRVTSTRSAIRELLAVTVMSGPKYFAMTAALTLAPTP
jgi:hypothetical protein